MTAVLPFTAHCARGHDRIDFDDRDAFEAHMTGEHRARKRHAGQGGWSHPREGYLVPAAPGWRGGAPAAPWPHKPAPRTAGGLEAVLEKWQDEPWPTPHRWHGPKGPDRVLELAVPA